MKMNREKLEKEYQKNAEQLQKLRNRQKVLLNQKRVEERKARTHRLIEHGAVLESLFPKTKEMSAEELKVFLTPVVELLE